MKTINLRAYRAWSQAPAPALIFAGVLLALLLLNGIAELRRPMPVVATPTPALIYVLSTREPTVLPTADPVIAAEIAQLKARLAELEARQQHAAPPEPQMQVQRAPEPTSASGYTANTDQGPVFVPDNATPVPNDGSYAGPFLAPAATEAPASPTRYCTGFGDWRDYDPMYAASPVCH